MVDPRAIDGDPYEVAERAVAQAEGLVKVLQWTIDAAKLMARNAEMERQMLDGSPRPEEWEKGPHGRTFDRVRADAERMEKDLRILGRGAAFNPRAPLGKA